MKIKFTELEQERLLKSLSEDCSTAKIGLKNELKDQIKNKSNQLSQEAQEVINNSGKKLIEEPSMKKQIKLAVEISKFLNNNTIDNNEIDLTSSQIKSICDYLDLDTQSGNKAKEQIKITMINLVKPMIVKLIDSQINLSDVSKQERDNIINETVEDTIKKVSQNHDTKIQLKKIDNIITQNQKLKKKLEDAIKSSQKTR